jgi:hypothetical protein
VIAFGLTFGEVTFVFTVAADCGEVVVVLDDFWPFNNLGFVCVSTGDTRLPLRFVPRLFFEFGAISLCLFEVFNDDKSSKRNSINN